MQFKNVTIQNHKKNTTPIINNISLDIKEGYITVITAKDNTDILSLCKALTSPKKIYQGEIIYHGTDIFKNKNDWLDALGYISDNNKFFEPLTIKQNIDIYSNLYKNFDEIRFSKELKEFNISDGSYIRNLSRGEFIKFQIVFAIAHNSKFLLFEDALAGLDIVFKKELLKYVANLLANEDLSVVFISKNIEALKERADYIYEFENGSFSNMKVGEY